MQYNELKEMHRARRDASVPALSLRIHRSLSWLRKAEQNENDLDAKFIFLWIAFNAAYAVDVDEQYRSSEKRMFEQFFMKIVELDSGHEIYDLVWDGFSGLVRSLLDNQYIFQPFWDYQNGYISEEQWQSRFKASKKRAAVALAQQDTVVVLSILFRRVYTLRNQVMHGGATDNSSANRQQLKSCTALLDKMIPLILEIMIKNDHQEWGDPFYPLISIR